jgi:hypothetical protein
LRIAEVLLPVIGERARVIDWFDSEMPTKLRIDLLNDTGEWYLVADFNWADVEKTMLLNPADFQLEAGKYWFSDFWSGKTKKLAEGEAYAAGKIAPHGCVMGVFRRVQTGAQYLGSDLHFSQGKEVAEWKTSAEVTSFTLRLPRKAAGHVRVALPWPTATAQVEGEFVELAAESNGIWNLAVKFDGFAHVVIKKGE